jgi:hypothetical protein
MRCVPPWTGWTRQHRDCRNPTWEQSPGTRSKSRCEGSPRYRSKHAAHTTYQSTQCPPAARHRPNTGTTATRGSKQYRHLKRPQHRLLPHAMPGMARHGMKARVHVPSPCRVHVQEVLKCVHTSAFTCLERCSAHVCLVCTESCENTSSSRTRILLNVVCHTE